jgi:hypothetical protein
MPNHPEPGNTDLGNDTEDKDEPEILICCTDSLLVSSQVLRAATADRYSTSSASLSAEHGVVGTYVR